MKRRIVLLVAGLMPVLLAVSLVERVPRLIDRMPRIRADSAKRAELRSGDSDYHRFLALIADAVPRDARLLLLVYDPGHGDIFFTYRASYVLYPLPHLYVPLQAPPPPGRRFHLDIDPAVAAAIREGAIGFAAIYVTRPAPAGKVYRVRLEKETRIICEEFAGPPVREAVRTGVFGARTPWRWPFGVALLVGLGWMLGDVLGFAALFRRSVTVRLAFAWLLGAALTTFWMLLVALAGMHWTLPLTLVPWVPVVAWWCWRKRTPAAPAPGVSTSGETPTRPASGGSGGSPWIATAGYVLIATATVFAVVEALIPVSAWVNWDAWAIWGIKARAFWTAGTMPEAFLLNPLYYFSHADYPPGMPLLQTWLGFWAGGLGDSTMRLVSPVYHLALVFLLAGLLAEFGMTAERWLLAGLYALMPRMVEQAHSGYADLALAAAVAGVLLLLARMVKGEAPPWCPALMCGVAGMIKGEALILSLGMAALILVWWRRHRIRTAAAVPALVLLVALLAPWRAAVVRLGIKPTYVVARSQWVARVPVYYPYLFKAPFLDGWGPGLTAANMREMGDWNPLSWLWRQRGTWLGFWYFVTAAVLVYFWPGISQATGWPVAALLVLHLACTWAVILGFQYDVLFILVTSSDRLLVQISPFAVALVGALVGDGLWKRKPDD